MNEILLIGSIFIIFGSILVVYKMFGKEGLHCYTVLATIAANIEVLITIKAFGMEMTLGNVLFAATFLITDILSETEGKEAANKSVNIGIVTSVLFIIFSQWWLLYTPGENDVMMPSMRTIFSNTPRTMFAGLLVYAIVQKFDVWAYHKWWSFTKKRFGDTRSFLWLRNNGSTMISQLLNAVLFTCAAFAGMYSLKTIISIIISSYVIFWVTSLVDTPFVYAARKIHEKIG